MIKSRTLCLRRPGFTLIELLTVIAILGILITVLVPAVQLAKKSANRATTKSMFGQWAQAINMYKAEYRYYPNLGVGQTGTADSYYSTDQGDAGEALVRALTGKNMDLTELSDGERKQYNKQAIEFCTFSNKYYLDGDPATKKLVDAFDNQKIRIVLDTDDTGSIILKEKPEDTRDLGLQPGDKINAKIAIYTLKADGPGCEDVVVTQ